MSLVSLSLLPLYTFASIAELSSLGAPTAKSNGISITMPYWDQRVAEMSKRYPDVKIGESPLPPSLPPDAKISKLTSPGGPL